MGEQEALAAASSPGSQRLRFDILCKSAGRVAQAMEMDTIHNNWTLTCVIKSQLARDCFFDFIIYWSHFSYQILHFFSSKVSPPKYKLYEKKLINTFFHWAV